VGTKKNHTSVVTTGSPETPRPSLRNGFTVSFVLSPVTGLFCHRRFADCSTKLDASVGASGPHDFAVRISTLRPRAPMRPSHPVPNVRDDREAPLLRDRTRESVQLICPTAQAKYFYEGGLDDPNQLESLQEIRVYAHAISEAFEA
jgi:hypothetical protein